MTHKCRYTSRYCVSLWQTQQGNLRPLGFRVKFCIVWQEVILLYRKELLWVFLLSKWLLDSEVWNSGAPCYGSIQHCVQPALQSSPVGKTKAIHNTSLAFPSTVPPRSSSFINNLYSVPCSRGRCGTVHLRDLSSSAPNSLFWKKKIIF